MKSLQNVKNGEMMSDEDIIELYFKRDENAISETDRKYRNYLYTIAYNILSNNEDSEECLNDTYLKTWRAIPPAMPRILRAFLAKITRNVAVDRYDEAKRQKRVPAELCDSLSDFEGFLPSNEAIDVEMESEKIGTIINEYLSALSDRELYIFMSRYYFAVPIANIAEKIGMSVSSINKSISKMKTELRERLAKGGICL